MKNTVFTVIAILLLLATAQFAVGGNTVHNYEDTSVYVSYVQLVASLTRVTNGWYEIEAGQSVTLPDWDTVGNTAIRVERNGEELLPVDHETRKSLMCYYHPHEAHKISEENIVILGWRDGLRIPVDSRWKLHEEFSTPTDGLERARYWILDRNGDLYVRDGRLTYNEPPRPMRTAVTIDGMFLSTGSSSWTVPNNGGNSFIHLQQPRNTDTCGPTCLEMVLYYYGVEASMSDIWKAGDIDTVLLGTWPSEMRLALNELGVPARWYDEDTGGYGSDPFGRLRRYVDESRPPCILIRFRDEETREIGYHWVVVVGYNDTGTDERYLIADPAAKADEGERGFVWAPRAILDKVWGFKSLGDGDVSYWDEGGSNPIGGGFDLAGFFVNFTADPYTAIVPESGSTNYREYGHVTQMISFTVSGKRKLGGGMRNWEHSYTFDYPFSTATASSVKVFGALGTGGITGISRVGERGVKIRGRIEDGWIDRGQILVLVRTYRGGGDLAAPAQVVSTRLPASSAETSLLPNYPNPFNPETWIPYQLSVAAEVTVTIHASDGKLVRTLELGQMPAGVYSDKERAAYWDGRNAAGEPVASGIYFYTLTAGDFKSTRKMVIRK